jgi:hypothetical protein
MGFRFLARRHRTPAAGEMRKGGDEKRRWIDELQMEDIKGNKIQEMEHSIERRVT